MEGTTKAKQDRRGMIVAILAAVVFLASGASKLIGAEMQIASFSRWDYPLWFMYVTGLLEVIGAVLVFLAGTRFYGAMLLGCIMVGAVGTHLMHGEFGMLLAPVALLALLAWMAWSNRPPMVEPTGQIEDMEGGAKRFSS